MRSSRRTKPESVSGASVFTWLVRIAVNEALMKLRRRRLERMVSLDEDVKTEGDSVPREVAIESDQSSSTTKQS
jgi:RNA polymerase sigma-70 factor (ECF subfamily)